MTFQRMLKLLQQSENFAPRIAGARAAKRCSIFRRAATASLSGIAPSAEHTIMPAAMSRCNSTWLASPIGSAPSCNG